MQQRQLRLGDILDDYCPRERRVTNHAIVAMVGQDVKQTRCTTCEAEHEYKHARVPRQRRKNETPGGLYAQVLATGPKRPAAEETRSAAGGPADYDDHHEEMTESIDMSAEHPMAAHDAAEPHESEPLDPPDTEDAEDAADAEREEGPVHRPLIRASLPRPEGQAPPARPLPEFTIRQPGNGARPNRFRPRHQRGGPQGGFHAGGNRSNGNSAGGPMRGGMPRHAGGNRPPMGAKRHHGGGGRKRSK